MKVSEAIKGYILDCRVRGRSFRTIQWYEQKLGYFARWLDEEEEIQRLDQVTIGLLRAFVIDLQAAQVGRTTINKNGDVAQISPLTVKGYVQVIKGFFQWCHNEELLESNPAARLKLPTVPEYIIPTFTPDHINQMLATCDLKTAGGYRDYTIMLVLLETGMRVSELAGLRLQDVHDDHVRVFGKGRKEREIGIAPEVCKHIWKYVHQFRKPASENEQYVFLTRNGLPFCPDAIKHMLVYVKGKAGLEGVRVSAHTFRHTFARMYLEQGGEIYKLSRLMGHSSVEVTEEYLKDFNMRAARQEQERFSPVGNLNILKRRKKKNS